MSLSRSKSYMFEGNRMDQWFHDILNSSDTNSMKKRALEKMLQARVTQRQSPESVHAMLNLCLSVIAKHNSKFALESCQQVFDQWSTSYIEAFVPFFNLAFVSDVLFGDFWCMTDAVWILRKGFAVVRRCAAPSYDSLCAFIRDHASNFVRSHPDVDCVTEFCILLLEHSRCVPAGENTSWFCSSLLSAMSVFIDPKKQGDFHDYVSYIQMNIGQLLSNIWKHNSAAADHSIQEIFDIISRPGDSSWALNSVVQFLPDESVNGYIQSVVSDVTVCERDLMIALCHMIDWLRVSRNPNVSKWIIKFIRCLVSTQKYSTLMEVAEAKVMQLFNGLGYSVHGEQCLSVITHLLLGYQYSPRVFHSILHAVPTTIGKLRHDAYMNHGSACRLLPSLAELLHCLMFLHPGFPDLYEPIVTALKKCQYPVPSVEMMREKISKCAWTTASCNVGDGNMQAVISRGGYCPLEPSVMESRSETGLTGLRNLGNTCYMNSVLQALYMCDSFRRDVLTATPTTDQPILKGLQEVFAYLALSERPAYSPEHFFKDSKPPWFVTDVQHDCSEFLKYLLDQLHEQEKACKSTPSTTVTPVPSNGTLTKKKRSVGGGLRKLFTLSSKRPVIIQLDPSPPATLVERTFGGTLVSTCVCLRCNSKSVKTESFTDLALAFPTDMVDCDATLSSTHKPAHHNGAARMLPGGNSSTRAPERHSVDEVNVQSVPLERMLDHFLRPERLEGSNRYHCDACGSLQDGERCVVISSAPPRLVLSLLRFAYDTRTNSHSKICTDVKIPLKLQVPISRPLPVGGSTNKKSQKAAVTQHFVNYCLTSAIVHSGLSSDGGHYYCYARQGGASAANQNSRRTSPTSPADSSTDRWFIFNDERVSFSSFDAIQSLTQNFARDTAYVLFYRICDAASGKIMDEALGSGMEGVNTLVNSDLRVAVEEDNRLYQQECDKCRQQEIQEQQDLHEADPAASWYFYDDSSDSGDASTVPTHVANGDVVQDSWPPPDYQ